MTTAIIADDKYRGVSLKRTASLQRRETRKPAGAGA